MAKSAAERKAAQRARQAASEEHKLELILDAQELAMLERNRVARRPGRDPYDLSEYITMLIRQDNVHLQQAIENLEKKKCLKCKESLPINSCVCEGDSVCWVTRGWHELKLI